MADDNPPVKPEAISADDLRHQNAFYRDGNIYLRCDEFGCRETHPIFSEEEQENAVGFGFGRWLGWLYLDLNRPDLYPRVLRFCCVTCCLDWLGRQINHRYERIQRPDSLLDQLLRSAPDELAKRRLKEGL